MKKPNITPGNWTHKATAGNHDFAIYPEETGNDVALVRDFNEANAQAIASVPLLLEALEALHAIGKNGAVMVHETGKPQWSALEETVKPARSALLAAGYTD